MKVTLADKIAFTGWLTMISAAVLLPGPRWGIGEWTFTIGGAVCAVGAVMQGREMYEAWKCHKARRLTRSREAKPQ